MNHDHTSPPPRSRRSDGAAEIDSIRAKFGSRWRSGERPRIEEFLARGQPADRPSLLSQLLRVELTRRRENGETPTVEEYLRRFPEDAAILRRVFDSLPARESPSEAGENDSRDGALAETVLGVPSEQAAPAERAAQRFGDYELLEEIGRGGMGVVYKARHVPLNRVVALKMINAGEFADEEQIARFHAEAEAAARLDHPHIVPVHEVGEQDGLHYFSMGFVEGRSLKDRLRDGPLEPGEAARLVQTMAEAVQYAHEKGVVHRDLKPDNVLIDAEGRPRITDFGLAKRLDADSEMTRTGQVMGTPSYMPPEQARSDLANVGPLSDVYSLGAILYALLTGRPPFQAANTLETLKQVLERDPVPPRQLDPAVDRDLETICLKCLEKDPQRRYHSAAALAEDLRRYLNREPITARPATRRERVVKWVKRKPLAAALVATVAMSVMAVVSILAYAYVDISAARDDVAEALSGEKTQRELAVEREREARDAQRATQIALADSYTNSGVGALERDNTPEALLWIAHAARLSADDPDRQYANQVRANLWRKMVPRPVRALWHDGKTLRQLDFHASSRYLLSLTRNDECYLWDVSSERRLPLPGGNRSISAAAWNPEGTLLVLATEKGRVDFYRFPDGDLVQSIEHKAPVRAVAFSPNGKRLAIAGRIVRVWDLPTESFVTPELVHPKEVLAVSISSSGDRIATGCIDDKARIFAIDGVGGAADPLLPPLSHRLRLFRSRPGISPKFIDEDRGLLTLLGSSRVGWFDVETGRVRAVHAVSTVGLLFLTASADSRYYAVGGYAHPEGYAHGSLWNGRTWIQLPWKMKAALSDGEYSPDGQTLLTCSWSGIVQQWEAKTGKPSGLPLEHTSGVDQIEHSPDGRWLAAAESGGIVRIWDISSIRNSETSNDYKALNIPEITTELKTSRDGRYLLRAGSSSWFGRLRSVRAYDLKTFEPISPEISPGELVLDSALSPDGRQIVTGDARKKLRFWNRKTGREMLEERLLPSELRAVEYTPDGTKIVCFCVAGEVLVLDRKSGEELSRWRHGTEAVRKQANFERRYSNNGYFVIGESGERRPSGSHAGFSRDFLRISRDGRWLITTRLDETLSVWDLSNGRPRYPPLQLDSQIRCFDVSQDEQLVVAGDMDGTLRVWDFNTGQPVGVTIRHPRQLATLQFSPKGDHVLTGSHDGMVRLWDWRNGDLVISPISLADHALASVFTPDGRWIVTGSRMGEVAIWDRTTGKRATIPFTPMSGGRFRIVVTPNQSHLVIASHAKTIGVKSLKDLRPAEDLDVDDLCTLSEILSSRKIVNSGVVNLTTDEWLDRWRRFRAAHPTYFEFP